MTAGHLQYISEMRPPMVPSATSWG